MKGAITVCMEEQCGAGHFPEEGISRRGFLNSAVTTISAAALQGIAEGSPAQQPETRVLDDPTIQHNQAMFKHGGKETIDGYLARPKAEGKYPAVLVIAGNRITEEYIPNTCAALAVAGFVGLAPNIFHLL